MPRSNAGGRRDAKVAYEEDQGCIAAPRGWPFLPADRAERRCRPQHGRGVSAPCGSGGSVLAAARRSGQAALERLLFPPPPAAKGRRFAEPDWAAVHRELKRPGVTLALLWDEYRGWHPGGYGYSAFCEHYRRWTGRLSPVMRQRHVAGERMFVDYSGTKMTVTDPATGAARPAEIFIAVMGASNMTYAEASWSQALPDWIGAHTQHPPPSARCRRWSCPTI